MYENYFFRFRRKYSQSRFLSITVSFSVFISFYLLLNNFTFGINSAIIYSLCLLMIFIISVAVYVYLFDFRIKRALIELEDIIYDYVDPKAFTEYLEATINFSNKKNISPSLWISYLKGLSYLNQKDEMKRILDSYGNILPKNAQIEAYRFDLLSFYQKKQNFNRYYDNMRDLLNNEKQLKKLEIKGYILNENYEKANDLLDCVFDNEDDLISRVGWHFQKGTVLIKLNRKTEAIPYLQFVLEHGNTSYYVEEAKYLLQY